MAKFLEVNVEEVNPNDDYPWLQPATQKYCVCCLKRNTCFINLQSCIHSNFLTDYFSLQLDPVDAFACTYCHGILKNITQFKQLVTESLEKLNSMIEAEKTREDFCKLHRSPTEVTSAVNNEPFTFEIKTEKHNYDDESDEDPTYTEPNDQTIKDEPTTDIENVPLSEIKKKVKKKKKKQPVQKEKFGGKVRVVKIDMEELMSEREKERQSERFINLQYKCHYCVVGFTHELLHKDHMEKRHTPKDGSNTCDICKSVLNTASSFKEHTRRHFKRFECTVCGRRHVTAAAIVNHHNAAHGRLAANYQCHCGHTTQCPREHRRHKASHIKKEQCTECGKELTNKSTLKTHMLIVHKRSCRRIPCPVCGVQLSRSGLAAHTRSAHLKTQSAAYCALCHAHFKNNYALQRHLKSNSKHVSDGDRRFPCSECGRRFVSESRLREHFDWEHLGRREHGCGTCHKVFKNKAGLKKHVAFVHDKRRPPRDKICDYCGKAFNCLSILRSHILSHTGARPLRCVHCPAHFAHKAALYTHTKLLHKKT